MSPEISAKPLLTPFWIIASALVGIADTLYLSWNHLMGTMPSCSLVEGCSIVLTSPYAFVFGEPLAYFGLIYYIYLLGLAILLAIDPYSRGLTPGMLVYAAIGLISSAVFVYMWIFLIHALCIYCVISAVTTAVVFALALSHFRATRSTVSFG